MGDHVVHKREKTMQLRSWVKPAIRQIVGGSAEFGGIHNVDGTGTLS
jgi:hypothetical protein